MTTLRQWFGNFTHETGEVPQFIVFGDSRLYPDDEDQHFVAYGTVVPFSEVSNAALDRRFDSGYGCTESPDLCAWSPSWVIFSDNYDGAECLCWVPRQPTPHDPIRPGGG